MHMSNCESEKYYLSMCMYLCVNVCVAGGAKRGRGIWREIAYTKKCVHKEWAFVCLLILSVTESLERHT